MNFITETLHTKSTWKIANFFLVKKFVNFHQTQTLFAGFFGKNFYLEILFELSYGKCDCENPK